MKALLRYIIIGTGAAGFILAALTVLLFNRSAWGWQALSVPTGSMRSTMSPGSLVITHRMPISKLRVGDVITHTNPLTMRTTLTHRIIKVYRVGGILTFQTKGDANPSPDPPVVGGLVQGKAVWHLPYAGGLLMWAKTWPGIVTLVYLPALLVMIHETRLLAAYLRKVKPYRAEPMSSLRLEASKPRLRLKWAIAACVSLFLVATAVLDRQAVAGPLTTRRPASHVLFILGPNLIAAKPAARP